MLSQNYNQLLERIARVSGLSVDDLDRRVEAKRAKLSGLISKEGAAQIVANELGIALEKQKLKISELLSGMKRVNVIGKIVNLERIREYSKDNRQGKIASMLIADETSNIRTVLWDTNHISLIETGKIKQDDVVEISNATIRNNELHLTNFSDIKLSHETINGGEIKKEKVYVEKKILDVKIGENVKIRGFVLQIFELRFFDVCPECKKTLDPNKTCKEHGKILPLKRALLNIVIDDGSESIRAVMFNELINKFDLNDEEIENAEMFLKKRESLIGNEMLFLGNIRQNRLFNNSELILEDISKIDVEELIKELEK